VDARRAFDLGAADYDRPRRQFVPCFDDLYRTLLELLPFPADAPIDVLDLGAGTGLVSALVAATFPHARLTLVDVSPAMLEQARARFADRADRFRYQTLDLATSFPDGRYDAVVSAIALHHLEDIRKRAVFANAHAALRRPGVFVNADQALGPTPELERRYLVAWLRQVRALGVSDADLALALERRKLDRKATLADQLAWLEQAGFEDVDCWFKSYEWVVYAGSVGSARPSPHQ
jgi:tRNA (cmo5U34)-methyltransferase